MTGKTGFVLAMAFAVVWAATGAAGCGNGQERNAEEAKPSAGSAGRSDAPVQAPSDGPTAIQVQCGGCMQSFERDKMTDIGGRWYCEACAAKQK